ncbi:beta-ketoacyl-[acyl-carrier-protein] synthase family protein [Leucobacter sp. M11]|uniref:beta-ketoacyl-[acyl-carrier-protein] synthase family protein n=1 Tax=Leucobacter sp. M11 TaxID=2993565 RepID=UPI002D807EA3|nr:beta-ketoacyl-[acyl-carrier-protein] synthase family protein [Leucobacter sp. M11]MEB4613753.1 beta-ketoacyl-[acyl-carrier-protein] synthase family protein [Leucobacter sp. M11]
MTDIRPPVITGIGIIAPGGNDRETFWSAMKSGQTATRRPTLCDPAPFRSQVAGEVDLPEPALMDGSLGQTDRAVTLLRAATSEAINDAGNALENTAPERIGVFIGSAVGATMSMERIYRETSHDGELYEVDERIEADLYAYFVPSSFISDVALQYNARGPGELVSNGCTSGIDAIGRAKAAIERGEIDVAIVGATEAPISPITFACFDSIMATSPMNDSPESASRPYDATRAGFVLAEGAAMLVMESREHAEARRHASYGQVSGYASFSNAHHMTGLRPEGVELGRAITDALAEAHLSPDELDYVNAHGSGTKQNDLHETAALKLSLGPAAYGVPVSSLKSMTGHSMGSIGAIEVAACLLAMRDNFVPPTANLNTPDPDLDLDYVPNVGREAQVDRVLSIASGFGGFQSAIIVERAAS